MANGKWQMVNSLTIIHGDDIAKSRNYFIELKSNYPNGQSFEDGDIELTSLVQILEGGSFFSEEESIFIENFFTKKKNTSDYKSIIDYLKSTPDSAKIVFWEGKELEKNVLTFFKNANIKLFKHPTVIFTFLYSIKPDNGKKLLQLFNDTLKTMDEEALFYMIIRHFRLLLAFYTEPETYKARKPKGNSPTLQLSNSPTTIGELKRLAPWQKTKLERQSSLFSLPQLIILYKKLFEIESASKTGNLPSSLRTSIDIFLTGL